MIAIADGGGWTITAAVSVGPVSSVAATSAGPRRLPATNAPDSSSGKLPAAGFTELHLMGVSGMGVPIASKASAAKLAVSPKRALSVVVVICTAVASDPMPVYTSSITASVGSLADVDAVTIVGPPRNTVSCAALINCISRKNCSELLKSVTLIARSTES